MKAIIITKKNIDLLAARYRIEEWEFNERLPIGYYLISDFGNEDNFDVITKARFDAWFNKNEDIDNGWFSITKK